MEQKNYWKGIEQLQRTPEFIAERNKEFTEELPVEEIFGSKIASKPTARRDFLKMMGFSVAAATIAASCKIPVKKAIPYVIKPEEIVPGLANYYASTYIDGSDYCSVLVKVRDGRPIKIEGNKFSSVTKGGTNARTQASILSLYDKGRFNGPKIDNGNASWDEIDKTVVEKLKEISGKGGNIRILSSTIVSPSTKSAIADFAAAYPNTKHITYESVSQSGMMTANEKSFGKRVIPGYHFENAKVIVSLGADFLGTWISPIEFTKQYVKNRKLKASSPEMSRHYQFETRVSLTGTNADKRVAVKSADMGNVVATLYNNIAGFAGKATVTAGTLSDKATKALNKAATDLWAAKGASLVVCGSNDSNIQILVNGINFLLSNYGSTIDLDNYSNLCQGNDKEVMELVNDMNAGKIDALILYNSNPVYSLGNTFADAMKKVGVTISFNDRADETTSLVKFACPDHHYLESWNDAEPVKGKFSLSQPTINPLFKTRQAQESLLKWSGNNDTFDTYIQKYWAKNLSAASWDDVLRNGVYEPAAASASAVTNFAADVSAAASAVAGTKGNGWDLVVYEGVGIGNGKYANNPWLQEMPDPVTKVVWDNVVNIPVPFAKEKGLLDGDMVEVKSGNVSIQLPVLLQPGQANNTVSIALGYGREKAGKAGNGVGQNVFPFVSFNGETFVYSASGVTVTPLGKHSDLAMTQTHHTFEGRPIVKETTLAEYKKNPMAGNEEREEYHKIKEETLYPEYHYNGLKWGMSIDLNACIGCGACVVSCNVENNVPVVGKDEVRRVHEMHWMRIDRYYSFAGKNDETITKETNSKSEGFQNQYRDVEDWESVEVIHQPMLCQHCENAPCENVCPVAATNHSSEGLNQMAYNRCIGTRYCANNCPYKVRRFNWLNYTNAECFPGNTYGSDIRSSSDAVTMMLDDLTRMVLNPDVVVRSRGVMEKCSFCVQRIQDGKLNAKKHNRPLLDGEVKTACQTACPADAIVFGNLNDKESEVTKLNEDDRTFYVLADLHTLPSIGYMTKVRNKEEKTA